MNRKGRGLSVLIYALAGLALISGIYDIFFSTRGYVGTTAVVVSVEAEEGADEEDAGPVITVEYDAEGKHYTEVLEGSSGGELSEGDTLRVLYREDDPSRVRTRGTGFGIYQILIGAFLIAWQLLSSINEKRRLEELKKTSPAGPVYADSVQGEERELYFLTDAATAKAGHRIEDRDRKVLYEARVTKFTLSAPTGFEFIDHEHGRTEPHLIGHETSEEYSTVLIDHHYTFTFDGEDIWEHLSKNGITVDSRIEEGRLIRPEYRIYRNGREIALAKSSSVHVHEEDEKAAGRAGNLMPAQGFYRIFTREKNLDLLFVTLMAFARTAAHDDSGGNYGMLFPRDRKEQADQGKETEE